MRKSLMILVAVLMANLALVGRLAAAEPVLLASARTSFDEVYAYPNPAVATSAVTFHAGITSATGLTLKVYDTAGQLVHEGSVAGDPSIIAGSSAYEYKWNFGDLASGAYFLIVKADGAGAVAKKTFVVVR
jgi:hypothetical protein